MRPARRMGVLTFHRCINYGTYWQARCLLDGLRRRGHDPILLDHRCRRAEAAESACALQPTLPTPARPGEMVRYRWKRWRTARELARLPRTPPFPLEAGEKAPRFRTVVVGSDEVWNVTHPWYGGCPLFFGDSVPAEQLVAFAASCGNFEGEALPETHAAGLRRFSALSVRDHFSQSVVEQSIGRVPALVLDPCLQFPPAAASGEPGKKYLAVYGHNFSPAFAAQVRTFAAARALEIVSIGYGNAWADRQWIAASPLAFPDFIARSAGVVTNFFHGCVFAILAGRPLAAELSPYRTRKIEGLAQQLHLSDHVVPFGDPQGRAAALLGAELPAGLPDRLAAERRKTADFLHEAGL